MNDHVLYVEPFAGMAGDMFLAALLDLGDPRFTLADLRALAARLVPGEARVDVETAWRGNLSGQKLTVETPESAHPPHRGYKDIEKIVRGVDLPEAVVERALAVFRRIAVAEGHVHGCSPDEVHFHEVGAVDTIVDVVGAAFALERLGVTRVHASVPLTGTGTVRCAHGEMPVPTPAVAEILRGRPMLVAGGNGERLTPTGAAILAEIAPEFGALREFTPTRIGYGAGHRDPKDGPPNILRVQLGSIPTVASSRATVWLAEVNLDDMTGEELAFATERLFAAGALDVWTAPIGMKKGRPGVVLSALARPELRSALESALLEHTSTLGIRWREMERTECARRVVEVAVEGRTIRVKVRVRTGVPVSERDLSPEHDDLAAWSRESGRSIRELERAAVAAALRSLAH
ncbi:MAG: nickel pincer cofactor biosynthesis protein LarC [Planctomycetota bacterium]|nr:nickel pincer cofactor biosynthesis protein LarC [Planctomycetota bacterium]